MTVGLALFVVTDAQGFSITQDAGSIASASLVVAGETRRVNLDPRPATALAAGATTAFRTLLNDTFDGIDSSGNPDLTVDWTFTAGSARAGTLTIAQYDAFTLNGTYPTCPECGGAIMDLSYNGAGAPTNLRWVQFITTTHPAGGTTSPYIDPRPNDDNKPFYFTDSEIANGFNWNTRTGSSVAFSNPGSPKRELQNPAAGTDLVFLDDSKRALAPDTVDWDASLYLVEWDGVFGGTVTIHDGLQWGFTIVPEPSTGLLLCLSLAGLGAYRRGSHSRPN